MFHLGVSIFVAFLHGSIAMSQTHSSPLLQKDPLPLLHRRSRLALVVVDGVQHYLDRETLRVVLVTLAPVVANGVGKDAAVLVECRRRDAAADVGVALEAVLGVLVPEVERAVGAGGAKGAVDGVEGDGVDGVDIYGVVDGLIAVALE